MFLLFVSKKVVDGKMSRMRQMYDYYVRPSLGGENGQDLVEYALLLAIIVAIGYLVYNEYGIGTDVEDIVTNANDLMRHSRNTLSKLAQETK